jgi:CxxC motif-containing protein
LTSVKTATPIPKQSIPHALRELKILTIPAPVYIGQIVIEDVAGTGIPVVATRDVAAKESSSGL